MKVILVCVSNQDSFCYWCPFRKLEQGTKSYSHSWFQTFSYSRETLKGIQIAYVIRVSLNLIRFVCDVKQNENKIRNSMVKQLRVMRDPFITLLISPCFFSHSCDINLLNFQLVLLIKVENFPFLDAFVGGWVRYSGVGQSYQSFIHEILRINVVESSVNLST